MYKIVEKVLLDLLRGHIIGKALDARKARFFDTNVASNWLSGNLLRSTSFMTLIMTLVQHETNFAIRDGNKVLTHASKKRLVPATQAYGDIIEEPPSQLDYGSRKPDRSRSCRRRCKNHLPKRENHQLKPHLNLSKSSKGKSNSHTEPKSDDEALSRREGHECHCRARYSGTESSSSVDYRKKIGFTPEKYCRSLALSMIASGKRELSDIPSCRYVVRIRQ